MRPGNPLGDHGQRTITLALILEPVLANDDGVSVSAPLAHQCRTGLQHDTGIERRAASLELSGQSLQASLQRPGSAVLAVFGNTGGRFLGRILPMARPSSMLKRSTG